LSDEVWLNLNGRMNTLLIHKMLLHDAKVGIWCSLGEDGYGSCVL